MSENEQKNEIESTEAEPVAESSPDVDGAAQTPDPFDETTVSDAMEERTNVEALAEAAAASEPAREAGIKRAMRLQNSENIARKRDLKTAHLK